MVSNLPRPGGNLTGVSMFAPELLAKQLELLLELAPQLKVIALLSIPRDPTVDQGLLQDIEDVARAKDVQLQILESTTDGEIDAAYASLGHLRAGAVVAAPGALADKLVPLAARHAVASVYYQRLFVEAGGLLSYGPSLPAIYVVKGVYTGKILNGAKPADLPIQQPTIFELVVNRKTAKAIGLDIPQSILARADEVIE